MKHGHETEKHAEKQRVPRILSGTQAIRLIEQITGVRISKSTLWRWHLVGRLTGTRIGKRFFTTEESVEAMLRDDASIAPRGLEDRGAQAAERIVRFSTHSRRNPKPESINQGAACRARRSPRCA